MRYAQALARGIEAIWRNGSLGARSDAELVDRFARTRDEMAFEVLVHRHGPMVLRVLRDVLRDPHAVQDAFQATFLVLARKAGSIARPETLSSWLYGVALRVAQKSRVEAERRRRHERVAAERFSDRIEPDRRASERAEALHDELSRLPESSRVVVILCYFEGLTYDEAACRLGVTEATVRGRLARARGRLRAQLAASGTAEWSLPFVPVPWISPTVRAGSRFAQGFPGAASLPVLGLAEGVLRTMILNPTKAVVAVVAFHLLAVAGVLAQGPASDPPPPSIVAIEPKARPAQDERLSFTLDQAIERMFLEDDDLRAKFYEIPSARQDVLTAGLRANPKFYLDTERVPYGRSTTERRDSATSVAALGTQPLEYTRKRLARSASAIRATKVTEAQYQDAGRLKIDTLSRAFIDAIAAREIARQQIASAEELAKFHQKALEKAKDPADLKQIEDELAKRGQDQAILERERAYQALGRLIGLSEAEVGRLEVVGELDRNSEPPPLVDLLDQVSAVRPDLVADRLGLARAKADVKLQSQGVYALTQPYDLQVDFLSRYLQPRSMTFDGMTAPLPVFRRNQVNIQRAKMGVTQVEVEQNAQERVAFREVEEALQEVLTTLAAAGQVSHNQALNSYDRKVMCSKYLNGTKGDLANVLFSFEREDKTLRKRVEAKVKHRKARVALNTAVGRRVIEP